VFGCILDIATGVVLVFVEPFSSAAFVNSSTTVRVLTSAAM